MLPITTHSDFARRLVATLSAGLVFFLVLAAASPRVHAELHADHAVPHADGCAVVMFTSGVTAAVAAVLVAVPRLFGRELSRVTVREIFVTEPCYLRQPERGPPAIQE